MSKYNCFTADCQSHEIATELEDVVAAAAVEMKNLVHEWKNNKWTFGQLTYELKRIGEGLVGIAESADEHASGISVQDDYRRDII